MDKKIFQKRGVVFALQAVESECFCKGLSELSHIEGQAGEQVIASLADLTPDLGLFTIEVGSGDIYTRPRMDLF